MPRLTPDGPSIYPECGTVKGYQRHINKKNRTQPCRPCKDASAKAVDKWRHENGHVKARLVPDTVLHKHGIKVGA